ncbi:hypothetical protein D3C71_1660450 [compost metagenome]
MAGKAAAGPITSFALRIYQSKVAFNLFPKNAASVPRFNVEVLIQVKELSTRPGKLTAACRDPPKSQEVLVGLVVPRLG